jgi:predicted  nucleic acid-binding Zn-ribbon protein
MTPLGVALDLQRELLDTGRQTVETSVSLQQRVNRALLDGVESQRELDLRILARQYSLLRRTVRRADEETPGPVTSEDALRALDRRVAALQTDREETVDSLVTALEAAGDTTGEVTLESFDTIEKQALVLSAALEQVDGSVDPLGLVTDRITDR